MPLLRLQLSPNHRDVVTGEASFAYEFSNLAAKACGRQLKFMNLEIVWSNRYYAGEHKPRGWHLTLIAADILNADSTKQISKEIFGWLNDRLASNDLDGSIQFIGLEHHMAMLGTTWEEVFGVLKRARDERKATEAGQEKEKDGRGAIKQPVPRPRL